MLNDVCKQRTSTHPWVNLTPKTNMISAPKKRGSQKNALSKIMHRLAQVSLSSSITKVLVPRQGSSAVGYCTAYFNISQTSTSVPTVIVIPEIPGNILSQGGSAGTQQTEFASWSTLFDEARVDGISIHYIPNTTAPLSGLQLATCCDYDSTITLGALSSIQAVARYDTGEINPVVSEWELLYAPNKKSRVFTPWFTTTSPAPRGCIYVLGVASSPAVLYGNLSIKWRVVFRNSVG